MNQIALYQSLKQFMPVYVISFITLEFIYNLYNNKRFLAREVSINVLSGLLVIITQAVLQYVLLARLNPYLYTQRLIDLPPGWYQFALCFFLYTFLQYCSHYLSHKVRFFWCLHEVHHSALHMNTSTGVRNSIFDVISTDALYLLIPLLGVEPPVFLITYSLLKIWGTFIHINEDLVSKIPLVNWIMIDPSAHHVHHARNPEYIDKNYGEFVNVYDKLFGTFVTEEAKPVYGSIGHDPKGFWDVQLYAFRQLFAEMRAAKTLREKLLLALMPPEWSTNRKAKFLR